MQEIALSLVIAVISSYFISVVIFLIKKNPRRQTRWQARRRVKKLRKKFIFRPNPLYNDGYLEKHKLEPTPESLSRGKNDNKKLTTHPMLHNGTETSLCNNVSISSHADNMLISHMLCLSRVSPSAARHLLAEVKKQVELIEKNPSFFPFADESDVQGISPEAYRKCAFNEKYKALYLVKGNEIHIDAVIDCMQENAKLF
jgi:hypothetical protein